MPAPPATGETASSRKGTTRPTTGASARADKYDDVLSPPKATSNEASPRRKLQAADRASRARIAAERATHCRIVYGEVEQLAPLRQDRRSPKRAGEGSGVAMRIDPEERSFVTAHVLRLQRQRDEWFTEAASGWQPSGERRRLTVLNESSVLPELSSPPKADPVHRVTPREPSRGGVDDMAPAPSSEPESPLQVAAARALQLQLHKRSVKLQKRRVAELLEIKEARHAAEAEATAAAEGRKLKRSPRQRRMSLENEFAAQLRKDLHKQTRWLQEKRVEVAQVEAEAARRREEARARERLVAEDQHKRTRRRAAALSGEEQGHEQENRGIPTRGRRRAILEAAERLIQHQAHSFNVSVSLGGHVADATRP